MPTLKVYVKGRCDKCAGTERPCVSCYCGQCELTKRYLDRAGVTYEVLDLSVPEHLAAVKELGFLQAPVVVFGTSHWSGFRPDLLGEVIGKLKGSI